MIRCPICQARLASALASEINYQCHRCGSDLSMLLSIEHQANAWLHQAYDHFIQDNQEQALACLRESLKRKNSLWGKFIYQKLGF
jgi:transposase-like protein